MGIPVVVWYLVIGFVFTVFLDYGLSKDNDKGWKMFENDPYLNENKTARQVRLVTGLIGIIFWPLFVFAIVGTLFRKATK